MFKKLRSVPALLVLVALVVSLVPAGFAFADDASLTLTAQYRQDVPVTLDLSSGSEISSLDPAILSDAVSIVPVENLFLGLTDYDPITSAVVPELASSWEVSEDGTTWTFTLRDDVMWMQYDPASGTANLPSVLSWVLTSYLVSNVPVIPAWVVIMVRLPPTLSLVVMWST